MKNQNSDRTENKNDGSINETGQQVVDYIYKSKFLHTIKELVAVSGYSDGYIRNTGMLKRQMRQRMYKAFRIV